MAVIICLTAWRLSTSARRTVKGDWERGSLTTLNRYISEGFYCGRLENCENKCIGDKFCAARGFKLVKLSF